MRLKKAWLQIIILTFSTWLLVGCGSQPGGAAAEAVGEATATPAAAPVTTELPTAAPTTSLGSSAKSATISGRVHLQAPPTPRMFVYAIDQAADQWSSTETEPADGEAAFSMAVAPGVYQVYAFSENGAYSAYSLDGSTLAYVTVAENQTVADIVLGPPGQSLCGAFGVPASPDGRFEAVASPSDVCVVTTPTTVNSGAAGTNPGDIRVQFPANMTTWYTPGELEPKASVRFVLYALKGQQMTVNLITDPDSSATPYATLFIKAADGTVLTPNATLSWEGDLKADQDYFIEVRSLAQQKIGYQVNITIPALGTPQVSGGSYVPVTPEVCKILQENATSALKVDFIMEASAPFINPITGEGGQGCRLMTTGTGVDFESPAQVMTKLVKAFVGWSEQPEYQADGPTGTATGMTRDMGLLLLSAGWTPAPGVQCPSSQPISACNLKPEQKVYEIYVQAAMK